MSHYRSLHLQRESVTHELGRKYKVRHLFLYLPTSLAQEGKEKRENRTVMIPCLRTNERKWLPLIRRAISTPWNEQSCVHSKRFVIHSWEERRGSPGVVQRPPEIGTFDANSWALPQTHQFWICGNKVERSALALALWVFRLKTPPHC